MTTAEGKAFIDQLSALSGGLLILTGGDPMLRSDFHELAHYATQAGLRVVAAVCGTLVTPSQVTDMKSAGIMAVSLSIDGADACTHDDLRGQPGVFEKVLIAAERLRAGGMPFQINTTVHRGNVSQLSAIQTMVATLGAATWDLFLLVPTGRARDLAAEALSGDSYEQVLHWVARQADTAKPPIKVTCAPRYVPIAAEYGIAGRGCLGGRSFAFLSATGHVQMCGFMPESAGNIRKQTLAAIWEHAPLFNKLRDPETLTQACGGCSHRSSCGGCRARALAQGDLWGADPCCVLASRGDTT